MQQGGPAAAIEVAIDDNGLVAEDITCRLCGYNLRGLSPQGRCPECGSAVGRSVHGDFLRYSDPAWVKHLSDGAAWLIAAVFLAIGLGVLGQGVDIVLGTRVYARLSSMAATAVSLFAYWKLTMPDPGNPETEALWNIRQMTRVLAVAGLGGEMSGTAAALVAGSGWVYVACFAVYLALSLAGTVGSFLLFVLMRRLALRIPNDRLAGQTRTVMWGVVIGTLAVILGAGLALAVMAAGASSPGPLICVSGVGGLAMLVFSIWWVVLLFWYRRTLKLAAQTALQTWMREQ